jgi:NAD(P)-dependent dehydrogenase (short-subunit alcohol dehydrogenase family)
MKKICLITGATRGIGQATAAGLAAQGMHIVMVGRSEQAGVAARMALMNRIPNASVEFLVADLSSQASIRAMAKEFRLRYQRLDVLINNAGVFTSEVHLTTDAIELQFAVNHLSYFLLTQLMLPVLINTPSSRIVNVSSRGHRLGHVDFNDLSGIYSYNGVKAYAQSKLCNILFTYSLARRLKDTGTTVNCLHPGSIKTEIGSRNSKGIFHWIWKCNPFLRPVDQGAQTSIYLASDPAVSGVTGLYFYKCKSVKSSALSYDHTTAEKLWRVSEEMTDTDRSLQNRSFSDHVRQSFYAASDRR